MYGVRSCECVRAFDASESGSAIQHDKCALRVVVYMCTQSRVRVRTPTREHTHPYKYTHTNTPAQTHKPTYSLTRSYTHKRAQPHSHISTHTHKPTYLDDSRGQPRLFRQGHPLLHVRDVALVKRLLEYRLLLVRDGCPRPLLTILCVCGWVGWVWM